MELSMSLSPEYSLRYPIGEFTAPDSIENQHIQNWTDDISAFPASVREAISNISIDQQRWSYRPKGWTITQLVHHCCDSHLNSIIRFKLALTEDQPKIKPYDEVAWAELPDDLETDLSNALMLLEGIHHKWIIILKNLTSSDLERTFAHPEHGTIFSLNETIGSYAWHCNHHLAHIKAAIASQGKYN